MLVNVGNTFAELCNPSSNAMFLLWIDVRVLGAQYGLMEMHFVQYVTSDERGKSAGPVTMETEHLRLL